MRVTGVIYLHDISQDPNMMLALTYRNFATLLRLCGEDAEAAVIIGTTKCGQIESRMVEQREDELSAVYWRVLGAGGMNIYQFDGSEKSAWKMVDAILSRFEQTHTMSAGCPSLDLKCMTDALSPRESNDSLRGASLESQNLPSSSGSPTSRDAKSPLLGRRPASIQTSHPSLLALVPTLLPSDQPPTITNEDIIIA
jgi:hypothetical protein